MHLLIVLAVIVGIAGVLTSLEMSRRAMVGRRMERAIGSLRSDTLRRTDLRGLAVVGPHMRPAGRETHVSRSDEGDRTAVRKAS